MHIRHVTVENIRRFGSGAAGIDLSLPPSGWIVLAGPNGAGKTTFLQVLALALGPTFPNDFADTMFSWLRRGAPQARSRLTLARAEEDEIQPRAGMEVYSSKADSEDFLVGDEWTPHRSAMSHGRESEGNRAFTGPWNPDAKGWFAVGYGSHRRLFGQAITAEAWAASTGREGAFLTLFRDDASLVHPIRWLMDLDHRSLDEHVPVAERGEARRVVADVVALLNDGLLGDTEVLGVDSRGLSVRVDGQQLSITNLGAGAQVLAALVVDTLRHMHARFGALRIGRRDGRPVVEHGGIVLIDEVEAHLHPAWQRRVGAWLTTHFPRVQFIVTTHSPFVCQAATEGGLVLLPAPGAAKPIQIADALVYRSVINGSVDEALLSDLFGMEHTWSESAEEKRARLAALEARVLTGKAKPAELREYRSLLSEIPQTMSDEVDRAAARLASAPVRLAEKR